MLISKLLNAYTTYKVKFGFKVRFRKNVRIAISDTGRVVFGNGVFMNNDCSLTSRVSITIDDDTIIGEGVKFYDHNHRFNIKGKLIKNQGFSCQEIHIGKNCWIGSNVTILKGVTIGDNCVIGAGSVIRKSIPKDSLVYGEQKIITNKIKWRFDNEES